MPEPEEHDPRFGGDYARDTHRGGLGDDYARDGGWTGAGRADDVVREHDHADPEHATHDHSDEPIGKASE